MCSCMCVLSGWPLSQENGLEGGRVRVRGEEVPETTTFFSIGSRCPELPGALALIAVVLVFSNVLCVGLNSTLYNLPC